MTPLFWGEIKGASDFDVKISGVYWWLRQDHPELIVLAGTIFATLTALRNITTLKIVPA